MVDLAERLVGLLAHVRRPAPAWLHDAAADVQGADADEMHRQHRQLADLVGMVEALALDAAHDVRKVRGAGSDRQGTAPAPWRRTGTRPNTGDGGEGR